MLFRDLMTKSTSLRRLKKMLPVTAAEGAGLRNYSHNKVSVCCRVLAREANEKTKACTVYTVESKTLQVGSHRCIEDKLPPR